MKKLGAILLCAAMVIMMVPTMVSAANVTSATLDGINLIKETYQTTEIIYVPTGAVTSSSTLTIDVGAEIDSTSLGTADIGTLSASGSTLTISNIDTSKINVADSDWTKATVTVPLTSGGGNVSISLFQSAYFTNSASITNGDMWLIHDNDGTGPSGTNTDFQIKNPSGSYAMDVGGDVYFLFKTNDGSVIDDNATVSILENGAASVIGERLAYADIPTTQLNLTSGQTAFLPTEHTDWEQAINDGTAICIKLADGFKAGNLYSVQVTDKQGTPSTGGDITNPTFPTAPVAPTGPSYQIV